MQPDEYLHPAATVEAERVLAAPAAWSGARTHVSDLVALTKPRLNLLVVATTFAGFYLAVDGPTSSWLLFNTIAGTWMVAAAAAAFNQVYERDTDALMRRTRLRPVPDGRLAPIAALRVAWLLAVTGLGVLGLGANLLAAGVALVSLLSYTLLYTPLKRRTALSTLVGGIPGGLPPVIGWAAARNTLSIEAAILFAIVFLWQMPHFLAIAWICRDDYRRARIPMLPVVEPKGTITAAQVVLYSAVLLPASTLPAIAGLAGGIYLPAAVALGAAFLAAAVGFARTRDLPAARRLFLGSVVYLPLLWAVMLVNHAR